ncbi:biliverdin-producing heme oxygenase [Frigoriglobus tundricola]|uniref:Bacteriophytochrome heme oxygenase BphO n=1 Tax=Frigoriglobus tundricola TaxID=2774151 RepID=A0A6M5YXP9_9BACT|nr:biliverdin-producing heme oxygenase [Frigoriglobus tundricola]QJW98264.1 bacteriophytochrome heme oxygenase BphO [Frigoriglobus tundricola]
MTGGRVLQLLKEGTAPQHEAVERRFDLNNRLRDTHTYTALLGRLYGFYQPLEAALGRVTGYEDLGLHLHERRKVAWLVSDLTALGCVPDSFPTCAHVPEIDSLGPAFGSMYVVEGASLGGRHISKLVAQRLGLTPDRGCSFFASYRDRIGPMWDAFRAALVRFAGTPSAEQQVVTAAVQTFESLDRWLARDEGVS